MTLEKLTHTPQAVKQAVGKLRPALSKDAHRRFVKAGQSFLYQVVAPTVDGAPWTSDQIPDKVQQTLVAAFPSLDGGQHRADLAAHVLLLAQAVDLCDEDTRAVWSARNAFLAQESDIKKAMAAMVKEYPDLANSPQPMLMMMLPPNATTKHTHFDFNDEKYHALDKPGYGDADGAARAYTDLVLRARNAHTLAEVDMSVLTRISDVRSLLIKELERLAGQITDADIAEAQQIG